MSHVRIYGLEITDLNTRRLIGNLTRSATPAALAAANQISAALDHGDSAGPLTPEMRDAILAAIQTPPPYGVKHLHEALLQDQRARSELLQG